MDNNFGRTSKLNLVTEKKGNKAILKDVYFTAPFKIMTPFYLAEDFMQVMLLTASAGIMEGDVQEFYIETKEGTKLEFLSQAFEKIHKMNEGGAVRKSSITIKRNSFLKYNPLPVIPFQDSAFHNEMTVNLEDETSKFIFTDILSCGRSARKEEFQYRYYHSLMQVRKAGKLIFCENTIFEPALFSLKEMGMYEKNTHLATLLFFNMNPADSWQQEIRFFLDSKEEVEGGVTKTASGDYVVKILGKQAQLLQEISEQIIQMISAK